MDIVLEPQVTDEYNALYKFICKGEKRYYTQIVIDESDEDKLVIPNLDVSDYTKCSCSDFSYRAHLCKHCLACIEIIRNMGTAVNIEKDTWRQSKKDD
jgi:hypothetical protein